MIDKEADLVFDWAPSPAPRSRVELDDESLRDGLQSPSVRQPPVQERVRLLRQMADLGIDAADIGMPVSGEAGYQATLALARAAADERLPIALNCAGRTVVADLKPIADISAKAGVPIEAMAFIGSSPIRMIAEGWTLMGMVRAIRESVRFAVREGLKVCLVT
ncbi:MAG: hypothetical protein ABIS86_15565 [Streptosporangiaceae bacterium]